MKNRFSQVDAVFSRFASRTFYACIYVY